LLFNKSRLPVVRKGFVTRTGWERVKADGILLIGILMIICTAETGDTLES
jgi:hypothetical protein